MVQLGSYSDTCLLLCHRFSPFLYHVPTSLTPTATPTIGGSEKPMTNKGATRSSQGESQNGKLHYTLCAVGSSTNGAIPKDHVLGGNVKRWDGAYARKPGSQARKAAAQPGPNQAPEAAPQQPPTIVVHGPPTQPEPAPPPEKTAAFCHLCTFWKRTPPPPTAWSMRPQRANVFLGTVGAWSSTDFA